MNNIEVLLERFSNNQDLVCVIHNDNSVTFGQMLVDIKKVSLDLEALGVSKGDRVLVECDFSAKVISSFISLLKIGCILIPLSRNSIIERDSLIAISGCEWIISFDNTNSNYELNKIDNTIGKNILIRDVIDVNHAGLVLFSSGSTGKPKGMVYDFEKISSKFIQPRKSLRSIPFLMIDHFGGINTIFSILCSLGTVITVDDRSVDAICRAIEKFKIELLPTTPSFLNLMLLSKAIDRYDLSSLVKISYGTEVMLESTLAAIKKKLPDVIYQQTYGLSEVGVLRTKSRDDGSLWMRIGGEGFETKVIDNVLWIKSDYGMEGYINAGDKTVDGWFCTQDVVEVDNDYFKILGRETDLINVAGQKVYPSEIEDVLVTLDNVQDVAVYGEPHAVLGSIVVAKFNLIKEESQISLKSRSRKFCKDRLQSFKIPIKYLIVDYPLHSSRQKKLRK